MPRKAKAEVKETLPPSKPAKKEKPSFIQFLIGSQQEANAKGMKDPHHPDMHYLGASPQCPKCDSSLPSSKEEYEKL